MYNYNNSLSLKRIEPHGSTVFLLRFDKKMIPHWSYEYFHAKRDVLTGPKYIVRDFELVSSTCVGAYFGS
jgi:hypothetical protein